MSDPPPPLSELEARLEGIGAKTREGLPARAAALREAAAQLLAGDATGTEAIARLAHRLRGVAASAGRGDLTERAARLEAAARGEAPPLAIAEGARRLADAIEAPPAPRPASTSASTAAPAARPKLGWRVVALDDEPATRRLLEITLRQAGGCEPSLFGAPGPALAAIEARAPDLVIVDAMMPDVDGLTFYRAARRAFEGPVVILSAATADELGWELPNDPRLAWMRKPFRPARLIEALRAFVEGA